MNDAKFNLSADRIYIPCLQQVIDLSESIETMRQNSCSLRSLRLI